MTQQNTGITRSSIQWNHALMCPESHVPIMFPQWQGATSVVMISPEMGAKFSQHMITLETATLTPLRAEDQMFALLLEGEVTVEAGDVTYEVAAHQFFYLPAHSGWEIKGSGQMLAFFKPYVALSGVKAPGPFCKSLSDVPAEPFLGDEGALLQVLFPDDPAFDWGINVFEFAPGGTLPQAECHFMEHGLYLLQGEGVYRLGDHWYPVQAGDAIWMAPYVLQWYAATGKTPSKYIYYKEMNRAPISEP